MRKQFVTFYSPGTLFSENTEKEIESWNTKAAIKLFDDIVERHGAKPYGFRFLTKLVANPINDGEGGKLEVQPKTVEKSGVHYITGTIKTYDDVLKEPDTDILASNMRMNEIALVIENTNSYKSTHEFNKEDCIVDFHGDVIERGDSEKCMHHREIAEERFEKRRQEMEAKYS